MVGLLNAGPQNLLEHLIEKGAKIDAISNDGTPLQIAAFESTSRKHIVEVLLNNRASVRIIKAFTFCFLNNPLVISLLMTFYL